MKKTYIVSISDFEIVKQLGSGSFGNVYLVRHKTTCKEYAAKVSKLTIDDEQTKQLLLNEIKSLKKCHDCTLVKFYGFSPKDFNNNDNYTLFFKYMSNGSLDKIIKNAGNALIYNTDRQIILIGIARGMMILHHNKIIHRDLKPSNVLIDEDFYPHISDFGRSLNFENYEGTSSSCGKENAVTPFYMAPELFKENGNFDFKVDVYAFGILMYEVLTDDPPYSPINNSVEKSKFTMRVVDDNLRPAYQSKIKQSLYDLCTRCWKPNPCDRPSFDDLFEMLSSGTDPVLGGDPHQYHLDGIDMDEINNYIDYITEESQSHMVSMEDFHRFIKKSEELEAKLEDLSKISQGEIQQTNENELSEEEKLRNDVKNCQGDIEKHQAQLSLIRNQLSLITKQLNQPNRSLDQIDSIERIHILATNLTTVTIPTDITRIPYGMFFNCTNLQTVNISASVKTIEESAFYGCSALTEVIIPSSVTLIAKFAFANCTALEVVVIPHSVTQIEDYAFKNCTSLTTLSLHSDTKLGVEVFKGCTKLDLKIREKPK